MTICFNSDFFFIYANNPNINYSHFIQESYMLKVSQQDQDQEEIS